MSKTKENKEPNVFCPKCKILMKRKTAKKNFVEKILGIPKNDEYKCPRCDTLMLKIIFK